MIDVNGGQVKPCEADAQIAIRLRGGHCGTGASRRFAVQINKAVAVEDCRGGSVVFDGEAPL